MSQKPFSVQNHFLRQLLIDNSFTACAGMDLYASVASHDWRGYLLALYSFDVELEGSCSEALCIDSWIRSEGE
jgi:hypothetical protein